MNGCYLHVEMAASFVKFCCQNTFKFSRFSALLILSILPAFHFIWFITLPISSLRKFSMHRVSCSKSFWQENKSYQSRISEMTNCFRSSQRLYHSKASGIYTSIAEEIRNAIIRTFLITITAEPRLLDLIGQLTVHVNRDYRKASSTAACLP